MTDSTEPAGKVWYLYLLECLDGSIYTGIALDVAARYQAHVKGTGARYTRAHPPHRILASQSFPDRSSASKAEYRVKQLSPAEKRHLAAQLVAEQPVSPSAANQIPVSAIDKVT